MTGPFGEERLFFRWTATALWLAAVVCGFWIFISICDDLLNLRAVALVVAYALVAKYVWMGMTLWAGSLAHREAEYDRMLQRFRADYEQQHLKDWQKACEEHDKLPDN